MLCIYCVICLAAMVCSFVIPDTSGLYVLPSVLYLIVPITKRIASIVFKRKARVVFYNLLVLIVCILTLLMTLALLVYIKEGVYGATPLFVYVLINVTCLTNICLMVFSQFKKDILLRIIHKTYAGEILLGLFLLMIAFSLVLLHNEPGVENFMRRFVVLLRGRHDDRLR